MKIFRIVFKNNKYLSDVDQEYIVMIRQCLELSIKSTREDIEISAFLELDFKCKSWCCKLQVFEIGLQSL